MTDSAAGATAYACGQKTYNGGIAVDVNKKALGTILEAAQAKGMKTGLVATSRITHATPASFASHSVSREDEGEKLYTAILRMRVTAASRLHCGPRIESHR